MKTIVTIAPSTRVKGGITTVIKNYHASDLKNECRLYHVASYIDGNAAQKCLYALAGILSTCYHMTFKKVDIVHIHGSDTTSSFRKYLYFSIVSRFNCKIIYHFHGALFSEQYETMPSWYKRRIVHFFEAADLVICLSYSWKKAILKIAPEATTVVLPNTVDVPEIAPGNRLDNSRACITFLGLIGNRKGLFDLIHVVKRMVDEGYDLILNIGGNGDVDKLMRTITALNLENHVIYLGWISDVERDRLLRETDIFMLPSYGEGLPMSILEAMAYGIPVISTFVGGIPELVEDNKTGILIHPGDLNGMYEAIKRLYTRSSVCRQFGTAGRKKIESEFNLKTASKKLRLIYDQI